MNKKLFAATLIYVTTFLTQTTFANTPHAWYISGNAGIFQGMYDDKYTDQTDLIAQNIRQTIQQYSYTTGLAVGYEQLVCTQYLLGAELSGNYNFGSANFASGAATSAFSDKIYLNGNIDLVFVPGVLLTDSIIAYSKIGMSYAFMTSEINSPVGFLPVSTNFNSSQNPFGVALGLGMKKMLSPNFAIFSEYNYHDYGTTNFSSFQNFTTTYGHSIHAYTQSVVLGISYYF